MIRAEIQGASTQFTVDTGSSVSLIQPDMCTNPINRTIISPFGVTGAELDIKGEQLMTLDVNTNTYSNKSLGCPLPTKADGIIGMDFLMEIDARLDVNKGELWLAKFLIQDHGSQGETAREASGTGNPLALTIFSTTDSHDRRNK